MCWDFPRHQHVTQVDGTFEAPGELVLTFDRGLQCSPRGKGGSSRRSSLRFWANLSTNPKAAGGQQFT